MIRDLARIWFSPEQVLRDALSHPASVPFFTFGAAWGIWVELMNAWRTEVPNTDGAPVLIWWLMLGGAFMGPAKLALQAEVMRWSANRASGLDYERGSLIPVVTWASAPLLFCLLLFARVPFLLDFDAVRFLAEARPEYGALAAYMFITVAWRCWSAVLVMRGLRMMYSCSWTAAGGHTFLAVTVTGLADALVFALVFVAVLEM